MRPPINDRHVDVPPEAIARAIELHAQKVPWIRIAAELGFTIGTVRRRADPKWAEKQRAVRREEMSANMLNMQSHIMEGRANPEPGTLAERDRAYPGGFYVATDVPPPGRSALDQRSSA